MKTADQVLTEHEDANEMHFHQVDREWIIKAMEEFAFEFAEAAIDRWGLTKVERPYLESYYNKIKMKTAEELTFNYNDIEMTKLQSDYVSLVSRLPKIDQHIFLNGYNGFTADMYRNGIASLKSKLEKTENLSLLKRLNGDKREKLLNFKEEYPKQYISLINALSEKTNPSQLSLAECMDLAHAADIPYAQFCNQIFDTFQSKP